MRHHVVHLHEPDAWIGQDLRDRGLQPVSGLHDAMEVVDLDPAAPGVVTEPTNELAASFELQGELPVVARATTRVDDHGPTSRYGLVQGNGEADTIIWDA